MDSRTIGQSIKRVFPSFVVGDADAHVNIVAMRNGQGGSLSRGLKDFDKDAIRLVIANPETKGGLMWIGPRAFERMGSALEMHLEKVDKGGNRPNQIIG